MQKTLWPEEIIIKNVYQVYNRLWFKNATRPVLLEMNLR